MRLQLFMSLYRQLAWALVLGGLAAQGSAAALTPIIPAPVKAEAREGTFELSAKSKIIADKEFKESAELLAARLRAGTGFAIPIKSSSAAASIGDIRLT